jgi:NAD(P)-dependent dehydrogenase (short-subunit alcohol dehydrogenase family)
MQRIGTEQDLIGAVISLARDMSGYVIGHNILVDGGWTAG